MYLHPSGSISFALAVSLAPDGMLAGSMIVEALAGSQMCLHPSGVPSGGVLHPAPHQLCSGDS